MLLQKPFDDIDDGNVVDVVAVARSMMMMILYLVVLKFLLFLIEPKQEETSNVTV